MSRTMGFRFSEEQLERLDRLAESMNVSRNRAVNLLIESAKVEPMVIEFEVKKNRNTQTLASERVAVSA